MVTVGFIEGVAEAAAMIVKIFSGVLSDWLGRRQLLAAIGYGLAAFTKPVFPLAGDIGWIVGARVVDRIGKGIRGAPRDALIADLSPPHVRGASFGLRQTLDTIGAFLGPLIAIVLMALTADSFRIVFWIAVIPAFISFALIAFAVKEPARHVGSPQALARLRLAHLKRLPPAFWMVVAVSSVLALARFSEAFLVLKALSVGLSIALLPSVMVAMNVVYALSAYPAGAASDRRGRRMLLLAGVATLVAADVVLAASTNVALMFAGVALWGLHMGLTQRLLATLVADTAPVELRGTGFGAFNFASGLAMLAASVAAGELWDRFGPAATFLAGAGISAVAFTGIWVISARFARPGRASG
jgi:MFS family permease